MSCLIPAKGGNVIFSSWALCLHMLGAPQHGAAAETLLAEMRQLMGAHDAPLWLQELPWGCCMALGILDYISAASCYPTYLPPVVGERRGNTELFHLSSPLVGEEQQSPASLLDVLRTRGSPAPYRDAAPSPQGSRAGRSRVPSKHARAGWQAGSFHQVDGST